MIGCRDRHADQLLDVTQERSLVGIAQGDGDTFGSGSRRTADTVQISLRHIGKVEIDDMADTIDIDPARGDVGSDQCAHLAIAKARQCAITLILRLVAVNRLRNDAGLAETAHHPVGPMLGACEYQGPVDRFAPQEICKHRRLGRAINAQDALLARGQLRERLGHASCKRVRLDRGMRIENVRLIEILLKSWHLETIEQLVPAANATPAPDFAALFPSVLALADSGDRIARDVLTQAGTHLANLAGILFRRLFPNSDTVPVAMSGGVFGSSVLVRQFFYNSLCSGHPNAVLNPSVIEPVRGALELARKGAAR